MKLENVGKLFDEVIRVVKEWIMVIKDLWSIRGEICTWKSYKGAHY